MNLDKNTIVQETMKIEKRITAVVLEAIESLEEKYEDAMAYSLASTAFHTAYIKMLERINISDDGVIALINSIPQGLAIFREMRSNHDKASPTAQ